MAPAHPRPPTAPLTRRRLLQAGAAGGWLASSAAPSVAADAGDEAARWTRTLDSGWRFAKVAADSGPASAAMNPGFDDSAWRAVRVPHDWSMDEPFSPQYGSGNGYAAGGIAWYRHRFTLDAALQGRLLRAEFDGVYDHAQVWINGHLVGGRPYGYSSFACELTRHLRFDGPNVLAVRVDRSRVADSRWFSGSGIYRPVRLVATAPLCIGHWGSYVSTPRVSAERAQVRVQTEVGNGHDTEQACTLALAVLDPNGRVVAEGQLSGTLPAGDTRALVLQLELRQPQRWSPARPVLYTLRSRVLREGRVVDETLTRFGVRESRFDAAQGYFLNGESLKLKGVCLHHDGGCLGAAVPPAVWRRRLLRLRALGANAIRTSHNPPDPALLDLCDELGFLVQAEAFDEFTPTKNKWVQGWNVGQPARHGYGEDFAQWSVRDAEDLVRRDRNHASVIMWSIGNEIDYPNDPFSHPVLGAKYRPTNPPASDLVRWGRPLVQAVKRLDPTRPVTAALASVAMSDAVGFGDLLDIAGYNYQEARYAEDHAQRPQRVIYGSENRHDYSAWAVVRDHAHISGQFLWTGIDYLGEAGRWPQRGADFGLLDLTGHRKPRGWFRQALWSDTPVVRAFAALASAERVASQSGQGTPLLDQKKRAAVQEHWNWPAGAAVTVSVYANTPEVQLRLNGRSLGTQPASAAVEGVLSWELPFEAGELVAVGLREGQAVAAHVLRTATAPRRIVLHADAAEWAGTGEAVGHIEFEIVDAQGVVVPDAAHRVRLQLGEGLELLGMGNGNLADVDNPRDAEHAAWQGRGLAVLRAAAGTQRLRVEARAEGLAGAEIVLRG